MTTVGLLSLGLTLLAAGVCLLAANLSDGPTVARLADFWGLVPLLLGLELLLASYHASRRAAGRTRVRLHRGAVAGLLVVVLLAAFANVSAAVSSAAVSVAWWEFGTFLDRDYSHVASVSLADGTAVDSSVGAVSIDVPPGGMWTIAGANAAEATAECDLTLKAATASQAREAAAGAELKMRVEGGRLHVWLEVPGHDPNISRSPVRVTAEGTITLPRRLSVSFHSTTAGASVTDFDGDVVLDTTTGRVEVRRIGGRVAADTSTGDILMEDVAGDVDVDTSTGSVEVVRVKGDIEVDTSTGWVHVYDPGGDVKVDSATGSCRITSTAPVAGDWRVETNTGSIDVTFPRNSDVSVSVRTDMGHISTNLGLAVTSSVSAKTASGVLGSGEHRIDLEADTGSITVRGTD
ncbi:MAG TPA: hypothetical protein DGR79_01320 [Clostridiales bacterium]|nr:hypothetical protein [Clostridiales bacterium]